MLTWPRRSGVSFTIISFVVKPWKTEALAIKYGVSVSAICSRHTPLINNNKPCLMKRKRHIIIIIIIIIITDLYSAFRSEDTEALEHIAS